MSQPNPAQLIHAAAVAVLEARGLPASFEEVGRLVGVKHGSSWNRSCRGQHKSTTASVAAWLAAWRMHGYGEIELVVSHDGWRLGGES